MVDIVQQVSTDIVLSDKSEAEAGTNNTKFMTPLRTKEAIDKNLVPFNAMSQSQFEAIRAANNEEFAASGFVHFGKHISDTSTYPKVNEGLYSVVTSGGENKVYFGRGQGNLAGNSKTNFPVINVAGVLYSVDTLNDSPTALGWSCHVKFPTAPDGKTTYNKSTGAVVNHSTAAAAFAAQSADPTNVEVVINRVDMWGFEAWLEEVNSTNPFVYPNGLIQSQATTMDDITTSASARPVTYYAVFDGDTSSKGKGVNFFTLTDAQKKKVLGNHKNNLYYLDDGRLVQWRLRQRTIAGAGNGDWGRIEASKLGEVTAHYQPQVAWINPQGKIDSITKSLSNTLSVNSGGFSGKLNIAVTFTDSASLKVADSDASGCASVAGECYFLVCGTVNRLNQGAYHPSFNPSGTGNYLVQNVNWFNWYQSHANFPQYTSTSDCFKFLVGAVNGVYLCNIGSGKSGRPDGRFYDAIYADGFGGVCRDMRYSAYSLDLTDFAEADQRVKNGTYRGFEKPLFTRFYPNAFSGYFAAENEYNAVIKTGANSTGVNVPMYNSGLTFKDPIIMWNSVTNQVLYGVVSDADGYVRVKQMPSNLGQTTHQLNLFRNSTDLWYFAKVTEQPSSVGGSFLQTDVIGSPANILATPQLANGWQGSWTPVIPDGTSKAFPRSRKALAINNRVYTANNGASWASAGQEAVGAENLIANGAIASNEIDIVTYQAFAKQTKPAANSVVYGGHKGIGIVTIVRIHDVTGGALLQESLIGKVNVDTESWMINVPVLSVSFQSGGAIEPYSAYKPEHYTQPSNLASPKNNSPAVKLMNYNVSVNQQGLINYAYTELKHNGTNWGDDSKVTIVDNQSTKTDLNGNTVLVGTAQLNEPLGWIKNKV